MKQTKEQLFDLLKIYMPEITSTIDQCKYDDNKTEDMTVLTAMYNDCFVEVSSTTNSSWHSLLVFDHEFCLLRGEMVKVIDGEVVREDFTDFFASFMYTHNPSAALEEDAAEEPADVDALPFPEVLDALPFEEVPEEELEQLEPMSETDAELVRLADENNILQLEVALLKAKIDRALSLLNDIISFSAESEKHNQRKISLSEAILCYRFSHSIAYDLAESGELPADVVEEEFNRLDALTCAWGC